MNNRITNSPNFTRNLVPANEYKGPILKLTKADKEKIKLLQKQKACYELELETLIKYSNKIKIMCAEGLRLHHKIFSMENNIRIVEDMIKEIKTSRLAKQIKKLSTKA